MTAYHLLQEFIEHPAFTEKPNVIIIINDHGKRLKVKKLMSYSTKMDTAFLELESYDRQGLKLTNSHFGDSKNIFVLGFFGSQRHLLTGANLKTSSKDFSNIIIDRDYETMGGFSGSPVLNEHGEVMGMLLRGNPAYGYGDLVKSSRMKNLLKSPKNKTSAVDQILYDSTNRLSYFWYFLNTISRNNVFANKSNFQRLKTMADEGSVNAQQTLKHLDKIHFRKYIISLYGVVGVASGISGLMQVETLSNTLLIALSTAFFGHISFSYCADAFTHFKNKKALSRIQKN